ncbi:MAG: sarcosine oxidase subunit gamma family protein [Gammaproteobacteria bacterium]
MAESDRDGIGSMHPGHYGADGAGTVLHVATTVAAWNVQGDPGRPSMLAQIGQSFGVPLPLAPGTTRQEAGLLALWTGPRSWLLFESRPDGWPHKLVDFDAKRDALQAAGGALFQVSASRIAFTIRGRQTERILSQGCPLDLDARAFAPGRCAQSVLGHVSALFYRHATTAAWTVFVARSLADDAWRSLCMAAAGDGYDVEPPSAFSAT